MFNCWIGFHNTFMCAGLLAVVAGCQLGSVTISQPREIPTEDVKQMAQDNAQFAYDLYRELRRPESENMFFSPYSISAALAMTYTGARGVTGEEMASVLHFSMPPEEVHASQGALIQDLNSAGKDDYQLKVANRLWGRIGEEYLEGFKKILSEQYKAELSQLDFAGDTEGSRQEINQWVEDQTEQRIKDLIKPGIIGPQTVTVLTNAIYFKGDWAKQFDKKFTREAPFHVTQDKQVEVPLMYQKEKEDYAELDGFKMLKLPYQGDDLSMVVLLPDRHDGLQALEKNLDVSNMKQWQSKLRNTEVEIWLPRFKLHLDYRLDSTLADMGMPSAFGPGADFSGMSPTGQSISAVIHQAFVEVNEEGTEAAAATAVVTREAASLSPSFRADRPFVFLIQDVHTGSILFMGRMANPSDE